MRMAITLSLLGAFLVLEAVVSLITGLDRRPATVTARGLRILCGGYLVFVAVLGWYPSIVVNVKMSLGSWNNLLQTFVNALVMGAAVFLSTRYMGRIVEQVENKNKVAEADDGKPKSSS
jgi:membrane protein implicated in regulation of membrane protease activity